MRAPLVLAIDLGTSGCKAAVVGAGGELRGRGRRAIETIRVREGGAEQDPRLVWAAVVGACREALAGCERREDVVSVAVCSQYSSLIPVDGAGRATHNMILWQDQRGAPARLGLRDS